MSTIGRSTHIPSPLRNIDSLAILEYFSLLFKMLLTRTAVFCPREPLSLHCRKATKSPDTNMTSNHIYAIALSNAASTGPPTWAISVQPMKQKRLFSHDHSHTSIFLPNDADNSKRRNSDGFKGEELLVKLLIGENSVKNIGERVQQVLSKTDKTQPSELWLRSAVLALQAESLCNRFNIDDFQQMATQTLASQQAHHEAVAVEVDFLSELGRTQSVEEMHETREKAIKEKKKESSHFGFRISRPAQNMPQKVRRVNSWERKDDAYGGLM
jgi:hypothetical protein